MLGWWAWADICCWSSDSNPSSFYKRERGKGGWSQSPSLGLWPPYIPEKPVITELGVKAIQTKIQCGTGIQQKGEVAGHTVKKWGAVSDLGIICQNHPCLPACLPAFHPGQVWSTLNGSCAWIVSVAARGEKRWKPSSCWRPRISCSYQIPLPQIGKHPSVIIPVYQTATERNTVFSIVWYSLVFVIIYRNAQNSNQQFNLQATEIKNTTNQCMICAWSEIHRLEIDLFPLTLNNRQQW